MAHSPSATPEKKHTGTGRTVVPTFIVVTKAAEKVKEKAKVAQKKPQKAATGAKSKLNGSASKPEREKQAEETDNDDNDSGVESRPRCVNQQAIVVSDDEYDGNFDVEMEGSGMMDLTSDPEDAGQSNDSDQDGEGSETEEGDEEDSVDSETELGASAISLRQNEIYSLVAERAKLRWRSAVYAFYKPEVDIEYVGDRRCHVFHCAARGCKATVRRFVVTKDKSSSANLYKHARSY